MADNDPVVFDRASAELIRYVVREELGKVRNTARDHEPQRAASDQWVPFVNDYSGTIPACSVVRISTGSTAFETEATSGQRLIHVNQASTVFTSRYAVTWEREAPQGGNRRSGDPFRGVRLC